LAAVSFNGLGRPPLGDPDEGRYVLIPKTMLQSGDFITPRLDGVLYFEKPPLHYWLTASAIAIFGDREWGARFWPAALGLLTLGLAWRLGSGISGSRTGAWSAIVLATSPLFAAMARIDTIDMTVSAFITATLACFYWAERREGGRGAWFGMFASAAAAVMAKGLIGLVIPGGVVLLYLSMTGGWAVVRRVPWATGLALFAVLAVPWHVAMALRHPDFLQFYFVHEHFQRFTTSQAARPGPLWYFVPVLIVGMLPWVALAPAVLRSFRRDRPDLCFLAAWVLFVVGFFSFSKSKMWPYVLPALPPLALLVGSAVAQAEREPQSAKLARWGLALSGLAPCALAGVVLWSAAGRVPGFPGVTAGAAPYLGAIVTVAAALCGAVLAARARVSAAAGAAAIAGAALFFGIWSEAPRYLEGKSAFAIAGALDGVRKPDEPLYALGCTPYTLAIALDQPIDMAGHDGELVFGARHLPPADAARRFPDIDAFRRIWESERTVWAVLNPTGVDMMQRAGLDLGTEVFRSGRLTLHRNRGRTPTP
jgi:4-amino-4-deoxy-L-arabinose transferase-like glycosyltransferase